MIRKATRVGMRCLLHQFTEMLNGWLSELLGVDQGHRSGRVLFTPEPVPEVIGLERKKRQGMIEVIDLLLHGEEYDSEDEIFVTTMWWTILVLLVFWVCKRLGMVGCVLSLY